MVVNKYAKYKQPTPATEQEQEPAPQNKYRKYLQPVPTPTPTPAAPAGPSLRSETDAIIEEAAANIPGGFAAFDAKPADPQRMAAMGYVQDPLAKSGYAKPRAPEAPMADTGKTDSPFADVMRGLEAPIAGLTGGGLEGWAKTTSQDPVRGASEAVDFISPVDDLGRAYQGVKQAGAGLIEGDMAKAAEGAQQASIQGSYAAMQMLPGSMTLKGVTGRAAPTTMAGAERAAVQASRAPQVVKPKAAQPEPVLPPPSEAPKPFSAPPEPIGRGVVRRNLDRIIGGGVGATAGGFGDAFAAEGDGSGGGPDIVNPISGAIAGMVAPRMAARGWRATVKPLRPKGFDQRVASNAVIDALSPAGKNPEEIKAALTAQFGDKPARLADLTQTAQNLSVGLSRLPGRAGELANEQADDVMRSRTGRLFSDVEATTNINPASVATDLDAAIKAASEEISPAYEAMFAKHAGVNSERLMQLADDPIVGKYVRAAIKEAESLQTTAGQAPSNARTWDLVKRGLDRPIDKAFAGGSKPSEALLKARDAVKAELDALMPEYKAIRDGADAPRMRSARTEGAKVAGGGVLVERVRAIASELKGKPLTALQMGAVEKLALDIEKGRGIDGIASERMRSILGAVFDQDIADGLVARIRADQTIIKNAQRRNPNIGSATSQAGMGGAGAIQNAADLAQDALAFKTNPLATALALASRSGSYTKAQRDLIADMLYGGGTDENLARIFAGKKPKGGTTPPAGPTTGLGGPATSTAASTPDTALGTSAPRRPEQAGFGGSRDLPMDEGSRMERARSMGFDVDRVAYRGLGRAYDESGKGGGRRYQMFTSSESDAAEYGSNVVSAYLRKGNNLQLDGGGRNFNSVSVSQLPEDVRAKLHPSIQGAARIDDIADAAQKAGYDSVTVANVFDNAWGEVPTKPRPRTQKDIDFDNELLRELGVDPADMPSAPRAQSAPKKNTDPVTIDVIFDTKNIRSKDAAFDPSQEQSSKLLAGMSGKAQAIGALGGTGLGFATAPDQNGDGTVDAQERMMGAAGGAISGVLGVKGLGAASGLAAKAMKGAKPKGPSAPKAAFDQRFMKEAQRLVSYNGGVDKALKAQQYVIDQLKNSKAPNAQDRLNRAVSVQYAIRRMAERSNRELDEIVPMSDAPATGPKPIDSSTNYNIDPRGDKFIIRTDAGEEVLGAPEFSDRKQALAWLQGETRKARKGGAAVTPRSGPPGVKPPPVKNGSRQ